MSDILHIPVTFRPGARLPAGIDDPTAVNRAIAAARLPDGDLLAPDIVAAASDPASPIHAAFEWDDAIAGERFREGQAFYLVSTLIDARTGERVYVSRYKETNRSEDSGRIRVNVRLLTAPAPAERAPAPPTRFMIHAAQAPVVAPPATDDPPAVTVIDHAPDDERSLVVFRRWVEAHKHEPAILRAALRVLHDAL